jgi:hypothetical protein
MISAEVKNSWVYISTSICVLVVWCLMKQRHNVTGNLPYTLCRHTYEDRQEESQF